MQNGTMQSNFRKLFEDLKDVVESGDNIMGFLRSENGNGKDAGVTNALFATLISYDRQAGTYVEGVRANPEGNELWSRQLAEKIQAVLVPGGTILEVGVGEATTLNGVMNHLDEILDRAYGFDLSWSRLDVAQSWLHENGRVAGLFVAHSGAIPLEDNSVDVVYSSHSLEPNQGRESEIISECLRVARRAVVLAEPIYELASAQARARMDHHGYVRGLHSVAESFGYPVTGYGLFEYSSNPLNPSGFVIIEKNSASESRRDSSESKDLQFRCPLTGFSAHVKEDLIGVPEAGIVYPVLRGMPILLAENAIIASRAC